MKTINSFGNWLRRVATGLRFAASSSDFKTTQSAKDFANNLRKKYPQQSPITDEQLIEAFIQKNPQYKLTYQGVTPASVSWERPSEASVPLADSPTTADIFPASIPKVDPATVTASADPEGMKAGSGNGTSRLDTVAGGMESEGDLSERIQRIARLLLDNRPEPEGWGEISQFRNRECPQKVANLFLLCCLVDYQQNSDVAWRNAELFVSEALHDPENIWQEMTLISEAEWKSRKSAYKLHWLSAGHNRLWPIAKKMDMYGGNAAKIWQGKTSSSVLQELWDLKAGEQISHMIVGALRDCGQVVGASDVKADVYVRRVLGRAVRGEIRDPDSTTELARRLNRDDPWQLDWPIWNVGKAYCNSKSPDCRSCYLRGDCAYAQKHAGP